MAGSTENIEYVIRVKDEAAKALQSVAVAAVAATAALVGISVATKAAAEFDKEMREVATLSPEIKKNLGSIKKDILSLSARMGVDAVESADAMYQAISAGIPSTKVLGFLEIAAKAATGGVTDLETAVDGITTVLNAFKLPVDQATAVSDAMFVTMKAGKTTIEELSSSMFNVAPIAKAAGVDFREVAAALAIMTQQGTPTSVATTQLRAAIVGLNKPSKEMIGLWNSLGFATGQAAIESLGMQGALEAVRDAAGGNIGEMTKLLGAQEAVQAALTITGESAAMFAAQLEVTKNSAGATQEAFDTMAEGISFQFDRMRTTVDAAMIGIGDAILPIVAQVVEALLPAIENMRLWITEHPKAVRVIVGVVAAVAALIIIIATISAAMLVFSLLFASAWAAIPVAVGLAVVGVVTWITVMATHWEAFAVRFKVLWQGIKTFFSKVIKFMFMDWLNVSGAFLTVFEPVIDKIKELFGGLFGWITEKMQAILQFAAKVVDRVKEMVGLKRKSTDKTSGPSQFSIISQEISAFTSNANAVGAGQSLSQGSTVSTGGGGGRKKKDEEEEHIEIPLTRLEKAREASIKEAAEAKEKIRIDRRLSEARFGKNESSGFSFDTGQILAERAAITPQAQLDLAQQRKGVEVNVTVQGSMIGLSQRELVDALGNQIMRALKPTISQI